MNADALFAQVGKGAGPGVEGADQSFDVGGAAAPVDVAFFLGQLVGVVGVGIVLGLTGQLPLCQPGQCVHDGFAAHVGKSVVQAAAGVVGVYRSAHFQQHGTGVQAFIHLHDGNTGFGIAGGNGPLDRSGTAPARQQGGVDVQATVGRDLQHGFGQDQAIGGDDHHIRLQCRQLLLGLFGLQADRLEHGNAGIQRHLFDRAGHEFAATASRAVGLAVYAHHIMAGFQQGLQGYGGKIRCSGKNNAHGGCFSVSLIRKNRVVTRSEFSSALAMLQPLSQALCLCSFSSFLRMRLRLSELR